MSIERKRTELRTLLDELDALQKKDGLTKEECQVADAKATAAKTLQEEVEAWDARQGVLAKGREVRDPILPNSEPDLMAKREIAGYMTAGDFFVASAEFANFARKLAPSVAPVTIPRMVRDRDGQYLVPITKEQRSLMQAKASALTLGSGVIEPMRLPEIVRASELDEPTLLTLVNSAPTSSDAVQYSRITAFTRAAAPVAPSAAKPPVDATAALVTWNVFTHAATMPLTEQQIADAPAVVNEINIHLLWDLDKAVEFQMAYGPGTGQNFTGFFDAGSGVLAGRTVAGDTLLDKIRRAITDVVRAGGRATAVYMDALDWEAAELTKVGASDDRYVWAIVRDQLGPRIWSVPVVTGIGAEHPTTLERNALVGDFRRGATRWVREAGNLSLGWINDQFTKNERTMRVESRSAFGVTRPHFFRKIVTAVGS